MDSPHEHNLPSRCPSLYPQRADTRRVSRLPWISLSGTVLLVSTVVLPAHASQQLSTPVSFTEFASTGGLAAAFGLLFILLRRAEHQLHRWLVPGIALLVFGALVGPSGPGGGVVGHMDVITPYIAIAIGWIGLDQGVSMDMRVKAGQPRGAARVGLVAALFSAAMPAVGVWAYLASGAMGTLPAHTIELAAGVVACSSAAVSLAGLRSVGPMRHPTKSLVPVLVRAAGFSNSLALIMFGLLLCRNHQGYAMIERPLSVVELAAMALGLGVVLGGLLAVFLSRFDSVAARVTTTVSMVALASGLAVWLDLSTLWVNFTLGLSLIYATQAPEETRSAVQRARPVFQAALLLFSGALVLWPPWLPTLVLTGIVVAGRALGRVVGTWLGSRGAVNIRADLSRGLWGQGTVSLAIAIALRLTDNGPVTAALYDAIVLSVLLHDVIAPWALRSLLLDAGGLPHRTEAQT